MTSFTQNAVCEHSLLFMQNMPYSLFSMQHGNFESVLIMFLKILN